MNIMRERKIENGNDYLNISPFQIRRLLALNDRETSIAAD